jgi:hypothetical protein
MEPPNDTAPMETAPEMREPEEPEIKMPDAIDAELEVPELVVPTPEVEESEVPELLEVAELEVTEEEQPEDEETDETILEAKEEELFFSGDFPRSVQDAFDNNEGRELLFEFLGTASAVGVDVLRGLRWAAANVLTASLPQKERLDMIANFEPNLLTGGNDDDDFEMTTQGSSIGENIAAAAAAESRRLEEWEEEKVKITEQAEKAANERVAAELAIQQQRLEKEQVELKAQLEKERHAAELSAVAEMEARAKDQAKAEEDAAALVTLEQNLLEKENQATKDKKELGELAEELKAVKDAQNAKEEELQAIKKAQEEQAAELLALKEAAPAPAEEAPPAPSLDGVVLRRYSSMEYTELSDEDKEKLRILREENPDWMESNLAEAPEETDFNPILGPVVADLGYKRLHFVSAGKLGTIPIWEKQRIYRNDRAKAMAKDKMKALNLGLPGVICLHEEKDGKLSIIDGQHRIGMMANLRDEQRKQEEESTESEISIVDFDRILVEVYPQIPNDENHKQNLFLEINKAEPVKLLDMPGVAKANDRNVITAAVNKLEDTYPKMFSPSQKCRVPNVNIDNLRNSLFAADVMKRHKLTTTKKLYAWVLEQNEKLGMKYMESDDELENPTGWEKASENKFFLGLESTWLYN